MKVNLISFTQRGAELGERVAAALRERGDTVSAVHGSGEGKVSLKDWTAASFADAEALVFVGAAGIAVRSIAPHVASKVSDPAVVVMDEMGNFVIPLLSGHIGGANRLSRDIAGMIGAVPVLTTGTDVRGVFAVDTWAAGQNLAIVNPGQIKWISARLLAGETIRVRSQYPIAGTPPKGVELVTDKEYDVLISVKERHRDQILHLAPRICALGIGSRRDIPAQAVRDAFDAILKKGSLVPQAVYGAFSLDMKSDECGIVQFCREARLPYRTFSVRELNSLPGQFSGSDFVKKTTGTDNVCERSAVCGCPGGRLILKKNAGNGVTMAVAAKDPGLKFEEAANG